MATPKSWSPYGNDQPPYGKSPSRSSSGPPGACRTPSRVRKVCRVSRMLILLFADPWSFDTGSDGPGRAESSIMARLLYMSIMSLDGYVADEAGSYDWAMPDDEVFGFVNDFERPVGTYLYGRR